MAALADPTRLTGTTVVVRSRVRDTTMTSVDRLCREGQSVTDAAHEVIVERIVVLTVSVVCSGVTPEDAAISMEADGSSTTSFLTGEFMFTVVLVYGVFKTFATVTLEYGAATTVLLEYGGMGGPEGPENELLCNVKGAVVLELEEFVEAVAIVTVAMLAYMG